MNYLMPVVPLLLFAPLARSAPIGAVVQTWHYNTEPNTVTVRVVNTSEKDVTGYNISINETYADGASSRHEMLSDFVDTMLLLQEVKGTAQEGELRRQLGDGVLHPGMARDETFPVSAHLTDYEALVDAVTYADGTSESTNEAALGRILDHRKAQVATMQQVNEIIKTASTVLNDSSPRRTAVDRLQKLLTIWSAQTHREIEFDPGTLKSAIADLKVSTRLSVDERDYLLQYAARQDKRISSLSMHTQLVKPGDPR
jgi:hypothetical protein